MDRKVIKPNKLSFFVFHTSILFFLILGVFSLVLITIAGPKISSFFDLSFSNYSYLIPLIFFIFALILFAWNSIVYKKEEYIISDNKIKYRYGTLFSDNSVEVNIGKIVILDTVLGFWQNLFFKTGNLKIHTAGNNQSSIEMKNIDLPMDMYENIQNLMRDNGYHLKKEKLVQSEKPHLLGIFGELLQGIGSFLIFGLYLFINAYIGFTSETEEVVDMDLDIMSVDLFPIYVIGGIIALLFIIVVIFKYLDLRRRKYDVFIDSIYYTEGFLTKHYSCIPMERVSDCENKQGFFSRIFGLHDIVISPEGGAKDIIFKNMVNGELMIKNIKYLKGQINITKPEGNEGESVYEESTNNDQIIDYTDKTEVKFEYDKDFTAIYKMDLLRTILGIPVAIVIGILGYVGLGEDIWIMLPIIILVFIPTVFSGLVQLFFTNFIVEEDSIDSRYKFLTNQHKSFSIDKITYLSFIKTPLDIICGTVSVTFRSIGSARPIVFRNIKDTPEMRYNLQRKVGIFTDKEYQKIKIHFDFKTFLKSSLRLIIAPLVLILSFLIGLVGIVIYEGEFPYGFLFTIIILLILPFIYLCIKFFYAKLLYSDRFYKQKLYTDFLESIQGIFYRSAVYVRKDNIKGQKSIKYPFTSTGDFVFNIAAQIGIESSKNQTNFAFSSSLTHKIKYIENTYLLLDKLDEENISGDLEKEVLLSSDQSIWNSIMQSIIFYIILIVAGFAISMLTGILAVVLVVLLLIWQIIYIRAKYYELQEVRILKGEGIIYKSRETIVYEKLNYVEKNQGFLGKIFSNGNVSLFTLGSGSTDMRLIDTPDYLEIYELLKKYTN